MKHVAYDTLYANISYNFNANKFARISLVYFEIIVYSVICLYHIIGHLGTLVFYLLWPDVCRALTVPWDVFRESVTSLPPHPEYF